MPKRPSVYYIYFSEKDYNYLESLRERNNCGKTRIMTFIVRLILRDNTLDQLKEKYHKFIYTKTNHEFYYFIRFHEEDKKNLNNLLEFLDCGKSKVIAFILELIKKDYTPEELDYLCL